MKIVSTLLFFVLMSANVLFAQQAVLITLDDARTDDVQYLPELSSYVKSQGVSLDAAFVSCPLCCPSRATMMTGLYVSNHGVKGNLTPLKRKTIFEQIKSQRPEVKTGLIGKYLNSYNGEHRPEFDFWNVYKGGMIYNWFNFIQNVNGVWTRIEQYVTDYYLAQAELFTDQYQAVPYLLYLHFTAPHYPAQTPDTFNFGCDSIKLRHFNKVDRTAPKFYQKLAPQDKQETLDLACKRARSLAYLDSVLTPFVKTLHQRGVKVIIVSDNGYMLGEYRHTDKSVPYEEAIRSFFYAFNISIASDRLTSFTDIATNFFLDFGVTPDVPVDGLPYSVERETLKVEMLSKVKNNLPFVATVDKEKIDVKYQNGHRQIIPLGKR